MRSPRSCCCPRAPRSCCATRREPSAAATPSPDIVDRRKCLAPERAPMPALSVLDLAMFLVESPERPLGIGSLLLLAPRPAARRRFADRLVARMLERPPGAPFNMRLHQPSLGLPRLEVDDDFDPAAH